MSTEHLGGRPILFVISGPSGAGKGTCLAIIARRFPNIRRSPTYTTRQQRPGEVEGVDYRFVSQDQFESMVLGGDIFEYTLPYRDHQYGSPKELLSLDPQDLVVELDFRGMLRTRALSARRVVSIFIVPPDREALSERIGARHPEVNIDARLISNAEQLETAWAYDYILVNQDPAEFEESVTTVVEAELLRRQGVALLARLDERVVSADG
jgi:guanylate kinase